MAKIASIAALLSLVVFAYFPPGIEFLHVLQKTAHPVTFAVVCVLTIRILRDWGAHDADWRRLYGFAFAAAVGLGGLTEVAQILTHRDPAWSDVLRDAVGAATGLAWDARLAARVPRPKLAGVLGILGVVLIFAPLTWCAAAYANRDLKFPTVAEFESPLDLYFIGHNDRGMRRVPTPAVWARPGDGAALAVPLGDEPWPGMAVEEPFPNWSGRTQFAFDITNPSSIPASITVRIEDRQHNQEFADRFNREFLLPPRTRTIVRVPLTDVESAPAGRRMDLAHIAHIGIFVSRRPAPHVFLLNRLWLE